MATDNYLSELKAAENRKKKSSDLTSSLSEPSQQPKATVALSVRIPEDTNNTLAQLCSSKGWSKTRAVQEAISLLAKSYG